MKPRFVFLFIITALIFASCSEKDLYDESKVEKGIADLIVPANFDWNMVNNVACEFTTSVATPVEVYTTANCDASSLIAKYTITPDQEALSIPMAKSLETLYVKTGNIVNKVNIENGSAVFDVPETRADPILPGEYDEKTACVYFPSYGGVATVMFEDYFPIEGDYDFNDFVANYSYVAKLSKQQGNGKDPSKFHVISLDFTVTIRALGGLYDYTPYLRVIGMKVNNKEGFVGDGATLIYDKKDPIVRIDGCAEKPAGALYLNTSPNEEKVPYAQLKTVTFSIYANNGTGTGVQQDKLAFDFFLEGRGHLGGTYEIHQRDFEPVNNANYASGLSTNPYYVTNNNLVWGLTVPQDILHVTEKTNFLKAYPHFKDWAESGGTKSKDWYNTNKNTNYLFVVE